MSRPSAKQNWNFHGGDLAERRAEEKMRRRTEVLNAAEVIAGADGWDALTIVKVARRARLSRALVYLYFRDKGDLLLGIRDRAIEMLARQMAEAAAQEATGILQLQAVVRASAAFVESHGIHFDALLRSEILSLERASRGSGDFLGSKGEPCRRVLAKVIAAGVIDGSIGAGVGDPRVAAAVLWRFIYGLLQLGSGRTSPVARKSTALRPLLGQALELIRNSVARAPTVGSAAPVLPA